MTLTRVRLPARFLDTVPALIALAAILGLLLAWPGGLLDKADHAAYAVCHRIPGRSFFLAGRQLPLCARCSGTYLGALAGGVVLVARGRGRARSLPPYRYLALLALFVLAWAVDGANSYLALFPDLPHLYAPHNLLRLITGTLQGITIAAVLLPIANLTLWAERAASCADAAKADGETGASIRNLSDVAWLMAGGAVIVVAVGGEAAPLLYPLALTSGLMVAGLIGIANTLLLLAALRRDGRAGRWREVATPLLAGVALALVELTAIGLLRAELTRHMGLPF